MGGEAPAEPSVGIVIVERLLLNYLRFLSPLCRFLEQQYSNADQSPPLLCWVRVRCGING